MHDLIYIDRETGQKEREKIYGGFFIDLLYGEGFFSRGFGFFMHLIAKGSFFSKFYGYLQKQKSSRKKIEPFIKEFGIDSSEFLHPVPSFESFNDFFIRKLQEQKRPIDSDPKVAALPADGRYSIFPKATDIEKISLKGSTFSFEELLDSALLAKRFSKGSIVMARLCPVDYHRFHFPCDGIPSSPRLINGSLYSVNPIALKKNLSILSENKRMITEIETQYFGMVLFLEIGATCVGSIKQTFQPGSPCCKGQEKGFFEFGGSCILLFFEEGKIEFDSDLISQEGLEVRAKWGGALGNSLANGA